MPKRQTTKEGNELIDAGRAAELLGYSYNAITNAIDAGLLRVAMTFERKGGGSSPLIRKRALDDYRISLIRRYETMPQHRDRLARLKKTKVMT